MSKILVTGSLAFDFIMDFPGNFADNIDPTKLHIVNLSFLVKSLKKSRGGTAGNIAYSLALLNTDASILGAVGEDFEGYLEFLNQHNIDTSLIKTIKREFTSTAFITTDLKDNQIAAFYPGAMSHNKTLKIKQKPDFMIISPNDPTAMLNFAKQCQLQKVLFMFDPGMLLPSLSANDLKVGIKSADILIGNDYEMGLLMNKLKTSEKELLNRVNILITTLGERGSKIQTKDQEYIIKVAKPKQVLDPTGAGDAYRAGFMAGYLRGFDLKTCGQMGSIASCYAVEKYGTTNHSYSILQFCRRYSENFKEDLKL